MHSISKVADQKAVRPIFAAIILVMLYQAYAIGLIPSYPTDDDGAYAAAGYQMWITGKPGVSGYKNVAGMGDDIYALGHIGAAFQGLLMKVFGVSIVTALLPSLLIGCACLVFVYLLGRELWSVKAGALAALFLSLSGIFFSAAHSARPDLMVALFLLVALWLAATAPKERFFWRLLFAGLVMGFSGDVHPNGFLLAPLPLLFWIMLNRPDWRLLVRATAAYGAGGGIGILYWVATHYWLNPEEFRRQSSVHGLATHGVKFLTHGLFGSLAVEAQRYWNWFWNARGHRHLPEGALMLASGIFLLWKGGRTGRAMVGIWALFFLIAAALMSNSFGWYLIFAWPFLALWMARTVDLMESKWLARSLAAVIIAAYLFNLGLWHWKASQEIPMKNWLTDLRAVIPAQEPVFASAGLWFAFWDRDFTHEPYLPFREIEARLYPETGSTGWEVEQRKHGWRYIAAYGNLRRMLDPEIPIEQMLAVEQWRNRADEVIKARNFSLNHCSVVTRFRSKEETITVFRVNDTNVPLTTNSP